MTYTAKQVLLLSHHENKVVESITNATLINTVPRIFLNNDNHATLTNINNQTYKAPNRYVSTKYAWLLEFVKKNWIRMEYVSTAWTKAEDMTKPLEE